MLTKAEINYVQSGEDKDGAVANALIRLGRKLPVRTDKPRLVNHFKIGADPEFSFLVKKIDSRKEASYQRIEAATLGFKTGAAWGADTSGRQVEIRPHASKSVLRVCASVLETLRWMVACEPKTKEYVWCPAAYMAGDGHGGHTHFGRLATLLPRKGVYNKPARISRQDEVYALDCATAMLLGTGVLSSESAEQRRAATGYGRYGDARAQAYGFEYRTPPCWLASPRTTHLVLTVYKLAVLEPELHTGMVQNAGPSNRGVATRLLEVLLTKFAGLDDDAALAAWGMRKFGVPLWPTEEYADFKAVWGMTDVPAIGATDGVVPEAIPAERDTIEELFQHLVYGKALVGRPVKVGEDVKLNLPRGYVPLLRTVETRRIIGIGEIVQGLCVFEGVPVKVEVGQDRDGLLVAGTIEETLGQDWEEQLQQVLGSRKVSGSDSRNRTPFLTLYLGHDVRTNFMRNLVRKALTCGALPIWTVGEVMQDSFQRWSETRKKRKRQGVQII